jgi:hypothetical protein
MTGDDDNNHHQARLKAFRGVLTMTAIQVRLWFECLYGTEMTLAPAGSFDSAGSSHFELLAPLRMTNC